MHFPLTHSAVAQDALPSGHALQISGTRQSPAEVHSTPVAPPEPVHPPEPLGHCGSDATHIPLMHLSLGHAELPSGQRRHAIPSSGQSASVLHIAPPAPPAPPVPEGHDGNDATHIPFTHVSLGHAVLPSEQSLHGAPIAGQSPSTVHWGPPPAPPAPPLPEGHAGKDVSHCPFTHSAVAQLELPSAHSLQICGTGH